MTKRNFKLYLKDILDAIAKIEEYTKDLSYEKFAEDNMVIDAVIRNFEIIGEASKNIPEEIKTSYPDIPWKEMAGMRDKVIHEYFGIDLDIVWKTIKARLSSLKESLLKILNSEVK
ncbi:MAG: DUF86 domain-containing protein [Candidatus Omnitrophica bacterium]|nr:DUF86 domain-containing protein [Candidatus Omnitrophota bacterium]